MLLVKIEGEYLYNSILNYNIELTWSVLIYGLMVVQGLAVDFSLL